MFLRHLLLLVEEEGTKKHARLPMKKFNHKHQFVHDKTSLNTNQTEKYDEETFGKASGANLAKSKEEMAKKFC